MVNAIGEGGHRELAVVLAQPAGLKLGGHVELIEFGHIQHR